MAKNFNAPHTVYYGMHDPHLVFSVTWANTSYRRVKTTLAAYNNAIIRMDIAKSELIKELLDERQQ